MDSQEIRGKLKNARINRALGLFVLFFGCIVILALVFSDTRVQKLTNLVSGSILCIIGGGMMLKSGRTIKSLK